jgi:hypothetical protein
MNAYHEQGLDEQRGAEVGAEPVVDFQDAGDEHDERNVKGEAGGAAGSVHAVDLVAIAGYRTRRDTGGGVLERSRLRRCAGVQDGCNVLDNGADEEHVGWSCAWPGGTPRNAVGILFCPLRPHLRTLDRPTTMDATHTRPRDRLGAMGQSVRLEQNNICGQNRSAISADLRSPCVSGR